MHPMLDRRGTPAKPPAGKKPEKICSVCGKRFFSRRRFAEHLIQERALAAFEAAHEVAASRVFGPGETIPRSEVTPERVAEFQVELAAELVAGGMPEGVAKDLAAYARRSLRRALLEGPGE